MTTTAAALIATMDVTLSGRTYSTRTEAIQREIVEPIAAGDVDDVYAEYDIEALADLILTGYYDGFQCRVSDEDFWILVEAVAK